MDGTTRTIQKGNRMKVLVACEESQEVCKAFRARGHEAYSCDIIEPSGGHPEWHIMGDVLPLLDGDCYFTTMDWNGHEITGAWDMIIAFPPCTYLTVSGNAWFDIEKYGAKAKQRYKNRYKAIVFFMQMVTANARMVAVENPIGIMSTAYKKPTQVIQPYEFGHNARKATCLWLKGLPPLKATNVVSPGEIRGNGFSVGSHADAARDENGKIIAWNDPRTAIIRSRTFPGIAKAMAEQWG